MSDSKKNIVKLIVVLLMVGICAFVVYKIANVLKETGNPQTGGNVKQTAAPGASGNISTETPDVKTNNYEEICKILNEQENQYNAGRTLESNETEAYYMPDDVAVADGVKSDAKIAANTDKASAASAGDGADDYSETDLQVAGVSEGDIVKTDGKYIYTLDREGRNSTLVIYTANDGKAEKLSELEVENAHNSEMFIENDKAIIISNASKGEFEKNTKNIDEIHSFVMQAIRETKICIYDISDREKPKKESVLRQDGAYETSRIVDGYLYTFSNYYGFMSEDGKFDVKKPEEFIPYIEDTDGKRLIPDNCLHVSSKKSGKSYCVMTAVSLENPDKFTSVESTFENADVFYVSNNNIYSAGVDVDYSDEENFSVKTRISKSSFDKGKIEYKTSEKVSGAVMDSYYMHEYNGILYYVFTDMDREGNMENGLGSLDKNLKRVGKIDGLGKDERIYSSYYIDNYAYFVTFRETDPVFCVDLSDPKDLKVKSELKLPGFSEYLHSFGEGKLLGIGKDGEAEDIKISMFDVSNPEKVSEICRKMVAKDSDCEAARNHRSVFVDEERSIFGFAASDYDKITYYLYSYDDDAKAFKKVHEEIVKDSDTYENVRGVRIGEWLYVVDTKVKGRFTAYHL